MAQAPTTGLKELLNELEDYRPAVPDELTLHLLRQSGYECTDVKTARLVSLAAQRFLAEVLHEARTVLEQQQQQSAAKLKEAGLDPKDKRPLLTVETLVQGLDEMGVNGGPPPYYVEAKQQ